ncbi:type I DNA topoisomerase [Candidatus Saccharibacteria bacterium]|nr:type I DNA topoisomerase [Candidatus Saccharibacteria bacterium]
MPKNLVIVESPAKARTIEKFLGKDYVVKSSFGHIRDLPKKGLSIDKDNDFTPTYEVSADKKNVISELKKEAKAADTVWLASDEDREGEAIAWHLCQALGLSVEDTKRIVFHEITKSAIEAAIENPRTVDVHLVDAQQARRVLDRLVGYELSPVLWKKIRPGLSAGRVQSVAVRLITEREREIRAHEADKTVKVTADLQTMTGELLATELSEKLADIAAATELLEHVKGAEFTVKNVEKKPGTRSPSAPFTTSTLQQEASSRLGYGVKQTMMLAQRLYENGHITYMRTDSTVLSKQAIGSIAGFVEEKYGKKYHQIRQFATKNESAQEAHEAIRPTQVSALSAGDDEQQRKLYELIWKRAVASQMTPAQIEKTEVTVAISDRTETLQGKGEVLIFDGFLSVYGGGKEDKIIPPLKAGDSMILDSMTAREVFSRPPARFSEASLVRKLEEMGIGRPSTYAPTIGTIQDRGYIEKKDLEGEERDVSQITLKDAVITPETIQERFGADRNKLVPTHLAEVTTDLLVKHFMPIVDYDFTANVEEEFDRIAEGEKKWNTMIADFYTKQFHPLVEASDSISRSESSQARTLGTDPKSGKPLIARYGRFGPMLQIGEAEDEEKPRFAPLPEGATLDTVTFEQALEMFKLPRIVGTTTDGKEIKANIGRFGPYVQVEKQYFSIKGHDPLTISELDARTVIAEISDKRKPIKEFPSGIQILNGPYGPYVKKDKTNARIPKSVDPEKLTEEEAQKLIDEAPAKKGGRRFTKRKSAKKK